MDNFFQEVIEDVLMFSLENNMPIAVKECLCCLTDDFSQLSPACQIHLVIALMPRTLPDLCNAAFLLDESRLLFHAEILRGLQFLCHQFPYTEANEDYIYSTLHLEKIVVMHYLCCESNKETVRMQLEQLFGKNSLKHIIQSLSKITSTRMINLIKRERNKFYDKILNLLEDEDECIKYIQGSMWSEFNETFWKSFEYYLGSYMQSIISRLPAVEISKVMEKISKHTCGCHGVILNIQTLLKQGSPLTENDLVNLIAQFRDEMTAFTDWKDTNLDLLKNTLTDCSINSSYHDHIGHNSTSSLATSKFYSKKNLRKEKTQSVKSNSLQKSNDIFPKRLPDKTPEDSKGQKRSDGLSCTNQRLLKCMKWCAVEVADVLYDREVMKKYSPGLNNESIFSDLESSSVCHSSNLDELSYISNDDKENKGNENEFYSINKTPGGFDKNYLSDNLSENLHSNCNGLPMQLYEDSPSSALMPTAELHANLSTNKSQACRRLSYVAVDWDEECFDFFYASSDGDDYVSETDYSDDDSVILESEDRLFPDFTRFLYDEPITVVDPVVRLRRLKPQVKKIRSLNQYVTNSCILSREDAFIILNEV